jgi:hypothetical protein
MKKVFEKLTAAVGTYKGEGMNHDNEKITANFELKNILDGRAFQI